MPETQTLPLTKPQQKFKQKFLNSFLFRVHALANVPVGFVAGMKLIALDTHKAISTIPYKYLNKNSFVMTILNRVKHYTE